MKSWIRELLFVAALLAGGFGMAQLLPRPPESSPLSLGIVTVASALLLLAAMVRLARRRQFRAAGHSLAVAGSLLVLLSMAFRLAPGLLGAPLPAGDLAWMSAESLPLLLLSTGMLGLAVGLALWLPALVRISSDSTGRIASLQERVGELAAVVRSQSEKLHEARTVDPMTGAMNKGAFVRRFDDILRRSIRFETGMALVLVQVDEWDGLTDDVLTELARSLQTATRGTDFVGRLGDREFGLLLGECEDPRPAIDRFLLALDNNPGFGRGVAPPPVRLSAVTVEDPSQELRFSTFLQAAREVLRAPRTTGGAFWGRVSLRGRGTRVSVAS